MISNTIADFISSAPLAEVGGSTAVDRFDYQKNWALTQLLSLHQGGGKYVLLCELHEDVAVLDCPDQPSSAVFYQIKTRDNGLWTLKKLTSRAKGKNGELLPSILGRLCAKAAQLKGQQVIFQFVTNGSSGYSFKSPAAKHIQETSGQCLFEVLNEDEWKTLRASLAAELGEDLNDELQTRLTVAIANIPLDMHNETTLGLVTDFLDHHVKGANIRPKVFYRTLFDELRRRTVAKRPSGSIADVCQVKGIDRPEFDMMLDSARLLAPATGAWSHVIAELHKDSVPLSTRRRLNSAYPSYFSRKQTPFDTAFRRDHRFLVAALESVTEESETLLELAKDAVERARKVPGYGAAGMSIDEELITVMMAFYENNYQQLPNACAQSKDQDA